MCRVEHGKFEKLRSKDDDFAPQFQHKSLYATKEGSALEDSLNHVAWEKTNDDHTEMHYNTYLFFDNLFGTIPSNHLQFLFCSFCWSPKVLQGGVFSRHNRWYSIRIQNIPDSVVSTLKFTWPSEAAREVAMDAIDMDAVKMQPSMAPTVISARYTDAKVLSRLLKKEAVSQLSSVDEKAGKLKITE